MKPQPEWINRFLKADNNFGIIGGYIDLPDCGKCSIVIGTDEGGYEHVSVSPMKRTMPTWDDMCYVKNIFWEADEEVYQIHPPKSEYVNLQSNCLHLWRPANGKRLADLIGG